MNEYVPSPQSRVADQVRRYEASGGTDGGTVETSDPDVQGMPCVIVTHSGNKTGATRKTPLIRVTHGVDYLLVASMGGAPNDPQWAHNLRADPDVVLQDMELVMPMRAREVTDPEERTQLWETVAITFPNYVSYQARTARMIPLFVLEHR
jgi:deazaflavin-dependent oxidoreductase (nitroreductase family)